MPLSCLFGHKWDGCKGERCGEIRNNEHRWSGCTCKVSGKTRDEEHDLQKVSGKCVLKCSKCEKEVPLEHE